MSSVICNVNCKYRKAVYCGRDFIMLNAFGQCGVWYGKDGRVRQAPDYREAEENTDVQFEKKQENNEVSIEETIKDTDLTEQTDSQGGSES